MFVSCFIVVSFLSARSVGQNDFQQQNSAVRSLEKVFAEKRTCLGQSFWDPCVRRCVGTGTNMSSDEAAQSRDCAGLCKVDSDYGISGSEFILRTDCISNGSSTSTPCAPKNLQFKSCDNKCYFPWQSDQRPVVLCADQTVNKDGYCLKPPQTAPTTIVDACGVCYGNESSCRDCRGVKFGFSKIDYCGVCDGGSTTCGLWAGAIDNGNLIISGMSNVTVNTNAPRIQVANISCQYMTGSYASSSKPVITYDVGLSKVTCLPPDQELDYTGVQIKIMNATGYENYSKIFEQKYKVVSKANLMPSYLETAEIQINNNIEFASIMMGFSFGAINYSTPVQCIIQGFGINLSNVTVNASRDQYEPKRIKCPLEISPNHPGRNLNITIFTILTGEMVPNLQVKLKAVAPLQLSTSVLDDGYTFLFTFNQPIDVPNNVTCQTLISDSDLCKFGSYPVCQFVGLNQLTISVDPEPCSGQSDTGLAKFGDTFRLKQFGLGRFGEAPQSRNNITEMRIPADYEFKSNLNDRQKYELTPRGVIVAPQKVRNCNYLLVQAFALRAYRGIQYYWTMRRNGATVQDYDTSIYLVENVKTKNYLYLNLEKFVINDELELNLKLTNWLGFENNIQHRIQIVNVDVPQLEIKTSQDPTNFDPSEGLLLKAYYEMPICANDSTKNQPMVYQWMVFSVNDQSGPSTDKELYIAPNTLPGNGNFTVKLEGWFQGQSANRGLAQLTITTRLIALNNSIEGSLSSTLSHTNGMTMKLNASQLKEKFGYPSFALPNVLQFEWQCDMRNINSTSDKLPCFTNDRQTPTLYLNSDQKKSDVLSVEPSKMLKDYDYHFRLKTFDTDRTLLEKDFRFQITDTDIPLVTFLRNRDNGFVSKDYNIPLEAIVTFPQNKIIDTGNIRFFSLPFDYNVINCTYPNASAFNQTAITTSTTLAYVDLSLPENVVGSVRQSIVEDGGSYKKILIRQIVAKGRLQANRQYKFVACAKYVTFDSAQQQYGYAVTELRTQGTIRKVDLNITPECNGLDTIRIGIKSITGNTVDNDDKVTYQFGFIDFDNSYQILSESSWQPAASVLCYPKRNDRSVSYAVEVCVRESCQIYRSKSVVNVYVNQVISTDDFKRRMSLAYTDAINSGRFLQGLTLVGAILQYAQTTHLNLADLNPLITNCTDIQIQLANEFWKAPTVLSMDKLKYFFSVSKQIDFSKMTINDANKNLMITMFNNLITKLKNRQQNSDINVLRGSIDSQLLQNAASFLTKANSTGAALLDVQRQIGRIFRDSVKSGGDPQDTSNTESLVYQRVQADTLMGKIFKAKPTDSPEILFPEELAKMYDSMGGVGVQTNYYENVNAFVKNGSNVPNFASKILDIVLFQINTGNDIIVNNLYKPIEIKLPVNNRQSGKFPSCHFYNEQTDAWTMDGIQTLDAGGQTVTCYANHLTAYTTIFTDQPAPTPSPTTEKSHGNNNGNGGSGGGSSSNCDVFLFQECFCQIFYCS